jgi:hypothetical protein
LIWIFEGQGMKLSKYFIDRHYNPVLIATRLSPVFQPHMKRKRSELLESKIADPPKYNIEGKFRRVLPYYYEYSTFSKERWYQRSLIDVFSTDFKDKPIYYYESAIKNSLININGKPVDKEYLIKANDVISHLIHRHEPPVSSIPVTIVHEDDSVLAVNKPPSIPVHLNYV